jgi:hypothetical protein
MATPDEIRQRVEQADNVRSARRAAAAQRVGELAQRRATIVEQLEDVERELGDVLTEAQDVIDVDELAEFTDLKSADLTEWLVSRKVGRGKRKKTAPASDAQHGRRTAGPRTPAHASRAGVHAARAVEEPERLATQAS